MPSVLFYVGGVNRGIGYVANPAAKGIAAFRLDLDTGAAAPLAVTEGIDNPTFLEVSRDGKSLAAVSEVSGWNEGLVTSYAIDADTGALQYLAKQPTRGDYTAHLGHDHSGRFVGIANYGGLPISAKPNKSIAIYPRAADGTLGSLVSEATHTGLGPDAARQERPHAHCIRWTADNKFVVVADLGIDKLLVYRFDAQTGAVTPHGETVLPPGSGPRHFRFHPTLPYVYLVNELTCTLATLAFDADAGSFTLLALASTLPPGEHAGVSCSAVDLAAGGRHLYVGNRGHDSVAGFAIDQSTGIAGFIGTTPCGGNIPRDFAFDPTGTVLAVANQESDRIDLFRYRPETGALAPFGTPIPTGSPTAVAFHPQLR
ncbi:lactonase family protein [uncultured Devosia sp.]|uniref:lactonase family protein n=1 Tax=uncultured Devosia sp. TaxID=211434 RepID=UPI0035CA6532